MHKKAAALITVVTLLAVSQLGRDSDPEPMLEIDEEEDLTITSMDMNFENLFLKWKRVHSKTYQSKEVFIF